MREEEKQNSSNNGSNMQKALRKRWVFPAIYIASAAVLLTGVLWFQSSGDEDNQATDNSGGYTYEVPDNETSNSLEGNEAVEVMASKENIQPPVHSEEEIFIKQQFYDVNASSEDQEAALVFYNNTYYPNTGVDYAIESGESFDVLAALSGTVVEAEQDSLLGNVVTVEHANGVTTHYSSLGESFVEVGQQVDQGSVIGTAGSNIYNKELGVHAHFEIRKDDTPVNPLEVYEKPVSSLEDLIEKQVAEQEAAEEEEASTEDAAEEDNAADEPASEEEGAPEEGAEDGASDEEENTDEEAGNE